MLNRQPGDRTLPTLISLLVIAVLLMTFDVRSEGGGVTGVLRSGTQSILAPLQKATAFVVNPAVDMIESLSNIASLRERNLALSARLAEAEAELVAITDRIARLELYERLYGLEAAGIEIGRTVANVIGQPSLEDAALIIDKGTSAGIVVGQPVLDTNGYVVGTVEQVTRSTATIVPVTVGPSGVAVAVRDQVGRLVPQIDSNIMRLELDTDESVLVGDRVVTSSQSVRFPAGLPVGEVVADAAPSNHFLTTEVELFMQPEILRVVVVLSWPPDPITAATPATPPTTSTTTTTSIIDGEETTTTTEGDG